MRVGPQSFIARPAWYDRNPAHGWLSFNGADGPHAITLRWDYTVPAGRKAVVESLNLVAERTIVNTTPGIAYAGLRFTPSGGSPKIIFYAILLGVDNTVKDKDSFTIGQNLVLLPGDKIEAVTYDAGVGGQVNYIASTKCTEFDA